MGGRDLELDFANRTQDHPPNTSKSPCLDQVKSTQSLPPCRSSSKSFLRRGQREALHSLGGFRSLAFRFGSVAKVHSQLRSLLEIGAARTAMKRSRKTLHSTSIVGEGGGRVNKNLRRLGLCNATRKIEPRCQFAINSNFACHKVGCRHYFIQSHVDFDRFTRTNHPLEFRTINTSRNRD